MNTPVPGTDTSATHKWAELLSHRTIWKAVFAVLLGIAGALLLPKLFGEEFATRQAARLYAPLAGMAYGAGSRERVSVLLIDDASLAQAGQTWPASYGYYARLLRGVEIYRPRAVFLDIVFRDARPDPTFDAFAQRLCALQASGIKVYLAATAGSDGALRLRTGLDELRGRCFEPVAVTYQPDEVDKVAWSYPLEPRGPGGVARRSAALVIHDDFASRPIAAPAEAMALSWGLTPAREGLRRLVEERNESDGGTRADNAPVASPNEQGEAGRNSAMQAQSYCRADYGPWEIVPFGVRNARFNDAEKPVCVFHDTAYAYDLANGAEDTDSFLEHTFKDRIVMIGTARQFSNDYVNSPIHGRIPGVYLHAMALDNLDTYGDDYKHAATLGFNLQADNLKLLLLVAAGLLPVVLVRVVKECTHKESKHRGFKLTLSDAKRFICEAGWWSLRSAVEVMGSLILVIALLYVGEKWLDIGFLTVVDIAVFALAAEWFEWNERLVEWLFGPAKHRHDSKQHKTKVGLLEWLRQHSFTPPITHDESASKSQKGSTPPR
ncbi:CHASE2 domain-containing protein [Paraburkholderia bannensis]|uniref:CHASE2 domain-containing protein n=1 Tax=Paraburkholderia bannensis TaxID=765414 RepID=UPI002AB765F1|nr:CHASE2 domain-containing protein [Paraburkholderia bannensis]